MTDYYPLIARAVSRLPDPSRATRRDVYDRAERALVAQLRNGSLPETLIAEEVTSLRQAAARLEGEIGTAVAPPPSEGPMRIRWPDLATVSQSVWTVAGATVFGLLLIGFTAWSLGRTPSPAAMIGSSHVIAQAQTGGSTVE